MKRVNYVKVGGIVLLVIVFYYLILSDHGLLGILWNSGSYDATVFHDLPERFVQDIPRRNTSENITLEPPVSLLKEKVAEYYITVLVKSAPKNFLRRSTVRSTWGAVSSIQHKSILIIFVIGSGDRFTQAKLEKESRANEDLLQIDLPDTIENQARKLLDAFEWVHTHEEVKSRFYVVTNDNCLINLVPTIEYLDRHAQKVLDTIHCGYMFESNAGVIRGHGRRSVPEEVYPSKLYPMFCRSQMVMLSLTYIRNIEEMSRKTNISDFHLDDVLLFGVLREKLKIRNSIANALNGGIPLLYDPWDDTEQAVEKMNNKWKDWAKSLKDKDVTFRSDDML